MSAPREIPHVVVIDPGVKVPELDTFNHMSLIAHRESGLPLTYHQPAMFGMASVLAESPKAIRGVVVLGSASSVNERLPWQILLEGWLKPLADKALPTLGICYGHQMLAHMYSGKVDFLAPRRTLVGFREIEMLSDASGPKWGTTRGEVAVSHQECVSEMPRVMRPIARSAELGAEGMEAMRHLELPIFSFQSHPEATRAFLAGHGIEDEPARLGYGAALIAAFFAYLA